MADDIALLASVLTRTEALVSGVGPEQHLLPTPCPGLDVQHLLDHLVGWARESARRVNGEESTEDPNAYRCSGDPAHEFDAAARRVVSGLRQAGQPAGQPAGQHRPGQPAMPAGMLLMEFIAHGWDLATATGESVTYTDEEAAAALTAGQAMLKPEFRGPGKAFGLQVQPPEDATAVERLVAFLGRDPRWAPSST